MIKGEGTRPDEVQEPGQFLSGVDEIANKSNPPDCVCTRGRLLYGMSDLFFGGPTHHDACSYLGRSAAAAVAGGPRPGRPQGRQGAQNRRQAEPRRPQGNGPPGSP